MINEYTANVERMTWWPRGPNSLDLTLGQTVSTHLGDFPLTPGALKFITNAVAALRLLPPYCSRAAFRSSAPVWL
jgi:hypothetical protein